MNQELLLRNFHSLEESADLTKDKDQSAMLHSHSAEYLKNAFIICSWLPDAGKTVWHRGKSPGLEAGRLGPICDEPCSVSEHHLALDLRTAVQ